MANLPARHSLASSGEALEEIDAICNQFEAAWYVRPQIADYLERGSDTYRDALFEELLRCEVELLRQDGRRPDHQSYLDKFPEYSAIIRDYLGNLQTQLDTAREDTNTDTRLPQQSFHLGPLPQPFGDYELLRRAGTGGMGVVYEATQLPTNRRVALKVIRPECLAALGDDERHVARQRFVTEFQAAAQLHHDHIVTVFDVGYFGEVPYYTMQFVAGKSLRAELANGPLEHARAARYIEQVASAVAAAHGQQILHRDLKPHNILLDDSGDRALLADFGLAKWVNADQELTRFGHLGTPAYMAPEQTRDASQVRAATDIYGLGATLYHLLTGHPPFQAATIEETMRLICEVEPVPPRRLNPKIPRDLETVCLKCLHKEPSRRYASAAELEEDLRRWREREPITARRVGWPERILLWSRRRPAVSGLAAVLLLLALISGFALAVQHRAAERRQAEILIEDLRKAPPDAVPFVLQSLAPLKSRAVSILREQFDPSVQSSEQLHLALALARLGHFEREYLVSSLAWTELDECPNVVRALAASNTASLNALSEMPATSKTPATRARTAIVMLILGSDSGAKEVLRQRSDPTTRTYFIHWCAELGLDPEVLITRFRQSDDRDIRTGLLLALGDYESDRLSPDTLTNLSKDLSEIYHREQDAYTLSVIEWLLQRWDQHEILNAVSKFSKVHQPSKLTPTTKANSWYQTSQNHRMVVLVADEFSMGSPPGDPLREEDEVPITMEINRTFAIAAHEVSRDQYRRFVEDWDDLEFPDQGPVDEWAQSGDSRPVAGLTWFDAAAYCNWLSAQEGIPEDQWCYLPKTKELFFKRRNRGYQSGMQAAPDYLSRAGYRLPTDAEWEYACRAGTNTTRFFGQDEALLPEYAWFLSREAQACGQLRPNDFGLFDTYGNVLEWCHDKAIKYENRASGDVYRDNVPAGLIMGGEARVLRGGGFGTTPWSLRSANRNWIRPEVRGMDIGFRVARTIQPTE